MLGTVLDSMPFVRIRWAWLSFPVMEFVFASVFLLGIIHNSHAARMQILKESSLASLCALDEHTRRHLGGIHDLEATSLRAAKTNVKLERKASGIALSLSMGQPRAIENVDRGQ